MVCRYLKASREKSTTGLGSRVDIGERFRGFAIEVAKELEASLVTGERQIRRSLSAGPGK